MTAYGVCFRKMTSVYDIREDFDISSVLPDVLSRLPVWRLQSALSYRQEIDRFLCAKSFLMLEEMLRENYGLDYCPEFSYESNGKPYLLEYPDIFFNISHCRKGIAVVVSDSPSGIDIEEIQYDENLAPVILNPEELAAVKGAEQKDVKFTSFWTLKESFLKLTGEGIKDNMKNVLSEVDGVNFTTEVRRPEGYVLSLATKTRSSSFFINLQG